MSYIEYLKEFEELYYVAMTLTFEDSNHVIAIANNEQEATKLAVDNVPFLTQITNLEPMNKKQLNDFLDKMADIEFKKKISYKFFHGKNINKNLTTI